MGTRILLGSALIAAALATLYVGAGYAGVAPVPVPEPSALLLLGVGAGSLAWWLRKRK